MSALALDQVLVESGWPLGICRDTARWAIPKGAVYDAVDFLFDQPGKMYKRGGSSFQSSALGDSMVLIIAVAAPEFPGDPRVVVIASDGSHRKLYDVTASSAGSAVAIGDAQPTENPPMYWDRLIITDGIGNGSGTYAAPQTVKVPSGTLTVANLGGTPPNARCSCVHLDRIVLANGTDPNDGNSVHNNRVWFSPVPDVEGTWDTAQSYIDFPASITGLASVGGVLIVFSRGNVWRVLGDLPPGSVDSNNLPNDNMEAQPLESGGIGCIDARSIVQMGGVCYFADESGVHYTNGAGIGTVTHNNDGTGIQGLWATAVAGYTPSLGSVVCAGTWRDRFLFVTVRHASSDPQSGARYQFLYDRDTSCWTTLSDGVTADMYATRFAPNGEIYAACGDTGDSVRLLKLSGLFSPASGNKNDANGEAVVPTVTFRPQAAGPGLKAFGFGHLIFDVVTSDTATLAVATARGLDAGSFTTRRTLDAADEGRRRFKINFDSEAANVKVTQANASATTEIRALEIEARPYDADSELA